MKILTAPFYALFSIPFYRQVAGSSLAKGFLYLLYMSAIASVALLVMVITVVLPQTDRFVDWVKQDMPDLIWTKNGLSMNQPSPYVMAHPEFGTLAVFDLNLREAADGDLPDVGVLVTQTKAYVRQQANEIRVYDLLPDETAQPLPDEPVAITPESVDRFYGSAKPWMALLGFVMFLPLFYLWKMFAALLFSLIALIMNATRRERLNYGQIYNLTLFALTPVILIQILQMLIPVLAGIPFGGLGSLIVTGIYLFIAVKKTEAQPAEPA